MNNHNILRLIFFLNIFVILFFSLKPADTLLNLGSTDKISHFSAYFSLSLLFCILQPKCKKRVLFVVLAICSGILIEVIQSHIPNRDMSWLDALTNSLGLISANICYYFYGKKINSLINKVLSVFHYNKNNE
jgi:hypothetical protein